MWHDAMQESIMSCFEPNFVMRIGDLMGHGLTLVTAMVALLLALAALSSVIKSPSAFLGVARRQGEGLLNTHTCHAEDKV